jgi:hypothetical protein
MGRYIDTWGFGIGERTAVLESSSILAYVRGYSSR